MKRATDATIAKLRRQADLARKMRDLFERTLEEAKSTSNWREVAERHDISPDADARDWMC